MSSAQTLMLLLRGTLLLLLLLAVCMLWTCSSSSADITSADARRAEHRMLLVAELGAAPGAVVDVPAEHQVIECLQ